MMLGGRLKYSRVVIESYRLYCTANVHNLQGTQICNLTRGVRLNARAFKIPSFAPFSQLTSLIFT